MDMATSTKTTGTTRRDLAAEVAYLTRALKAPSLRESVARLAERARSDGWTHEEFLVACLQREVAAREAHGGEGRIRAARLPARKSLEEFDFDHARGLKRDTIAHLGTLDFAVAEENVVFLGPLPTPGRRRGGLHPLRGRGRQPVLPTGQRPLRARQPDRHLQQAVRQSAQVPANVCKVAPNLHGFDSPRSRASQGWPGWVAASALASQARSAARNSGSTGLKSAMSLGRGSLALNSS